MIHGNPAGELSRMSTRILAEYGLRYRLGPLFQHTVFFGVLTELLTTSSVSLPLLMDTFRNLQAAYLQNKIRTRDEVALRFQFLFFLFLVLLAHSLHFVPFATNSGNDV